MKEISEQDGFTLIEALMAMMVLTIGILALSTMQIRSIDGNATANSLTSASSVAMDYYERIVNAGYNSTLLATSANPHSAAVELTWPSGVTAVVWSVQEGVVKGTIDIDGDGVVGEADEVGIKAVNLVVNYVDKSTAKALTVTFLKHELF